MNGFKIPEVASLGRVLSKDELKAIIGGAIAKVTCTCELHLEMTNPVDGKVYYCEENAEPTGTFATSNECTAACINTCNSTSGCKSSKSSYKYEVLEGSGVGS